MIRFFRIYFYVKILNCFSIWIQKFLSWIQQFFFVVLNQFFCFLKLVNIISSIMFWFSIKSSYKIFNLYFFFFFYSSNFLCKSVYLSHIVKFSLQHMWMMLFIFFLSFYKMFYMNHNVRIWLQWFIWQWENSRIHWIWWKHVRQMSWFCLMHQ